MKLRQNELCHNCQQYGMFEFDDITEKQVIYCPHCKHEHWRELDEGTLTNIRLSRFKPGMQIYKAPEIPIGFMDENTLPDKPIEITKQEVIGIQEDGRAIVKDGEGDKTKIISKRHWGRDPRQ